MTRLFATIALAGAGLMLLGTLDSGHAGSKGSDSTFQLRNHRSLSVTRYPGDQAFEGGTVRMQGPDKGPYVERCRWSAEGAMFGLPFGLIQRCHRYTLENTPE